MLNKGENPSLSIGQVASNPVLRPKQNPQLIPNPLQFEQVLDIVVKVGEDTKTFTNVPPNVSLCDAGAGYVISDDKTEITNEVEKFGTLSQNILNNVPYHKKVVSAVKQMMLDLNPNLQKEAQRDDDISKLKAELSDVKLALGKMTGLLEGVLKNNNVNSLFGKE